MSPSKIKYVIFNTILIVWCFSFDGFDVATVLSFLLLPFISLKNFLRRKFFITRITFLFFIFFSILSIFLNFNNSELSQVARFAGVVITTIFIISESEYINKNESSIFKKIVIGVFILDVIGLFLIFVLGVFELPLFKPFYPSFRFQGFYNLTILAIIHSLLLFKLFFIKAEFNRLVFLIIWTTLFLCLILSLTRTAWVMFLLMAISFSTLIFFFNPFFLINTFKKYFIIGIVLISISFFFYQYAKEVDINNRNLSELLIARIVDDSFNTSNSLEQKRGSLYYPRSLLKMIGVSCFGHGLGYSERVGGRIFGEHEVNLGTHNTYVHILLDFGLFAFISFVLFNLYLFLNLLKFVVTQKTSFFYSKFSMFFAINFAFQYQDLDYYLPLMSIMIMIFVTSMFSSNKI